MSQEVVVRIWDEILVQDYKLVQLEVAHELDSRLIRRVCRILHEGKPVRIPHTVDVDGEAPIDGIIEDL